MFEAAKDLKRARQIVGTIRKYGFGPHLPKRSVELSDEEVKKVSEDIAPRRFRMMLEELGPSFIKLGQLLSSRPDLVSSAYVEELKQLQYQCEPLSYAEIETAIETSLGEPVSSLFESIDENPLATASIAQVHRGVTKEGQKVAVKVQRPGIREEIRSDIDILYRVAQLFDLVVEESGIAEPVSIVREFETAMKDELNFQVEAANVREFGRLKEGKKDIAIPSVHDELCSDTVLTLEFLEGRPFTDALPEDIDKKAVAQRILQEAFEEVFIDGFFHADPHPGNILLLEDGRYGLLDFGLCGRLTPQMRETLVILSLAVALKDADTAARTLYRLGQSDTRVDISSLRDDLNDFFTRYLNRRIEDVDSTLVMQALLMLAIRHKIRIPAEYTMLGRAGGTIEGMVRELDPDLDVAAESMPYAQKLLVERMGGGAIDGGLGRMMLQFQGMSQDVPLQLSQILSDLSAGNLQVKLQGKAVERLNSTLLVATGALSGAILGAAFVIGAFIALSQVEANLLGIPIVAIVGALAGVTIFSWVSAYVLVYPRLRKIRLSGLIGKKR